jgi:hypothetical protein
MDCLNCQNCYTHTYNYTQYKNRCKKKGHKELDQIPEGEKGKCFDFKLKTLSKK